MLTDSQLKKIMPNASQGRRNAALPILNQVAKDYDISNERRMAAWLATLAVESGELRYQEEIASGAAYEGRADLGNTQKGDGRRFKGHGRIQITGRANHQSYTNYLKRSGHLPFIDFVKQPELLAQEPYATDAAGWFWAKFKGLNAVADRGDFLTTQIKVNGRNKRTGLPNHWKERNGYFLKALSVLPDDFSLSATANNNDGDPGPAAVSATGNEPSQPQVIPQSLPIPIAEKVAIEGENAELKEGFLKRKWKEITGYLAGVGGITALKENADSFSFLGLTGEIMKYVLIAAVSLFVLWLVGAWLNEKVIRPIRARLLTSSLVTANATATNTVTVASPEHLAELEKQGYTIVRRS